jgi:general secretion pathway protein F
MATYYYKAVGKGNAVIEGSLEGPDEKGVARMLQGMGLIPLQVSTQRAASGFNLNLNLNWRKITQREVMFFTQELSTLVNAGLPLDRGLSICHQLSTRPSVQNLVDDLLQAIKGGKSFADSLATHPEAFSRIYINMVRAGEAGGSLPQVMERLVEFQQSADELRSYLISSLIYPAMLTLVGLGSVTLLLNYVIPKFASVFQDAGRSLPLPTQILLSTSQFTKSYWWAFLLGAAVLAAGGRQFITSANGRRHWDGFKLRFPVLGAVLRKIEVARLARTLGTLVHNSVPLVQSLTIVREISGNVLVSAALVDVAEGVKKGEGLAKPMAKAGVFPPLAIHLLEVGEETGKLDTMLLELARIYDKEVRTAIKNLIALFEPVMILAMAVVVGVIIISMMLAIVSINDVPL